jgi:hypothetical protein
LNLTHETDSGDMLLMKLTTHFIFTTRVALLLFLTLSSFVCARAQIVRVAPTPTPEKSRPKGSITGRVVGEDGQPLAGAHVYAQWSRASGDAGGSALTKADGTFKIENLERAPYVVTASMAGYFDTSYLEYERGQRVFHHLGESLTLTLTRGGVITGRVTDARGDAAAGVRVNMVRVRTLDGRAVREVNRFMRSLERETDDRGIYRNYGLLPGVYVVSAAGHYAGGFGGTVAHGEEAPTFYPSTTRDASVELTLHAGEELSDIDIRLRADRGHVVSGTVAGVLDAAHAEQVTTLSLISSDTTEYHAQVFIYGRAESGGFAFDSLTDGEYDLVAERYTATGEWRKLASSTRRVRIKGADVTGLRITLDPLGSISGRLVFESAQMNGAKSSMNEAKPSSSTNEAKPSATVTKSTTADVKLATAEAKPSATVAKSSDGDTKSAEDTKAACAGSAEGLYNEAAVVMRRESVGAGRLTPANEPSTLEISPDDKGEFTFRSLGAGAYRLEFRLGEGYFVTSMRRGAQIPAAGKPSEGSRQAEGAVVRLQPGESASGLVVTAAYGAASLKGEIKFECDDCRPEQGRVYLLPQERERADDALRYAEAVFVRRGRTATFAFDAVAPGNYKILEWPELPQGQNEPPSILSEDGRARLRREAEQIPSRLIFTLAPCQHSKVGILIAPDGKSSAGEIREGQSN